jgi:hypothetical protein
MTRSSIAALTAALLLAGCGPKALALPDQPIDRAATCGVAAAAAARLAVADVKAPLPLAEHARIVHYALLAASEGGEFQPAAANAVSRRMSVLQDRVTSGKWQDLVPACAAAYPATAKGDPKLPDDLFAARLQCNELAQFLTNALKSQETSYGNEIASYRNLRIGLNDAIAPGLTALAGSGVAAQQRARHKALAEASRLGAPVAVMARCIDRFGRRRR